MTAPAARSAYDPFAPAGGGGFPERRLRRAGVDDATVARLRETFSGMSRDEQRDLNRFVSRNTDRTISSRFQGSRTRDDLEAMKVDELEDLLRQRDLPTSGRKAELVDRLLASYSPTDPAPGAPLLSNDPVPHVPPAEDGEAASGDVGAASGPSPEPAPTSDAAPAPDSTDTPEDTRG